jgi:tetratricopeptide (TPR) repeat protein
MKVAILVCAMAATALAQPAAPDRSRAEALEKEAHATKDAEKYVAAGTAYLDLYNANPPGPGGDELLYNAGVSFESGRAIAIAIQCYAMLQKTYPKSKLAAKALARTAKLYGDIAQYDKAAEKLEEYAKKYAGEKDAYDAMSDAIYYRRSIGHREKAIENTQYFIKTFSMKKPREAADASWSLQALYEDNPDQAIKHLREYLRIYGSKGGGERVVIANARIGQLLWKQSCRGATFDGLCATSKLEARTCGTGNGHVVTPIKRNAQKANDARDAFEFAIKEFEKQSPADPVARYYYAQAKLALADAELEPYLSLAFPKNLDFDVANKKKYKASQKRFDEWIQTKMKSAQALNKQYEAVLAIKDTAGSITAAHRFGVITSNFEVSILTGELPRSVKQGAPAVVKAYCDTMTNVAEPLEAKSLEAFGVCLVKSTELSWFGESSRLCERELSRIRPEDFPLLREIHAKPGEVAAVLASEPPL